MDGRKPFEMVILAGGLGTRLRTVVSAVPKPMAPVASRPFLAYLLDHWIGEGIERFVLSTGYLGHIVKDYFGSEYKGARIDYVQEEMPLGTGGALRFALASVAWEGSSVLMANGDTWYPVRLEQFHQDACRLNADIAIALKHVENNDRYGCVTVAPGGLITAFSNERQGSGLINGGCYLLNAAAIAPLLEGMPPAFSLEKDVFVDLAAQGKIASSIQDQPFLDIGVPADYQRAPEFLA